MADIDITRSHSLAIEDARIITDNLATKLEQKLNLNCERSGDNIAFQGSGVKGTISLDEKAVKIQAHLGMMMKPLKPMITDAINERLDKVLA